MSLDGALASHAFGPFLGADLTHGPAGEASAPWLAPALPVVVAIDEDEEDDLGEAETIDLPPPLDPVDDFDEDDFDDDFDDDFEEEFDDDLDDDLDGKSGGKGKADDDFDKTEFEEK